MLDRFHGGYVVSNVETSRVLILEGRGIGDAELEYFTPEESEKLVQIPLPAAETPSGNHPSAFTYLVYPNQMESRKAMFMEVILAETKKVMGRSGRSK